VAWSSNVFREKTKIAKFNDHSKHAKTASTKCQNSGELESRTKHLRAARANKRERVRSSTAIDV
jgi:hypothetical protein